ncbi:MAG: hypothetical protein HYV40_01685 [Candidatus Levybacteria bacterium]|nr:hypothetical protein [Candidatus Levybacteria bacterium]
MEPKKNFLSRILRSYRSLPQKKQYVEFFTAILTVPVLLTVIILNVSNLRQSEEKKEAKPTQQPEIVVTVPEQKEKTQANTTASSTNTVTPTVHPEECKKEIGPIEIISPEEEEAVTDNPVTITIQRINDGYCAVVWSYRLNNGRWSEYDDKSIALYNPPKGPITFELKVKSVVTGAEKIFTRKFTYDGSGDTASQSAYLTN